MLIRYVHVRSDMCTSGPIYARPVRYMRDRRFFQIHSAAHVTAPGIGWFAFLFAFPDNRLLKLEADLTFHIAAGGIAAFIDFHIVIDMDRSLDIFDLRQILDTGKAEVLQE